MALFKGNKNKNDAANAPARRAADDKGTQATPGAQAAECMRIGQLLVDGDSLILGEPRDCTAARQR